MMMNRTAEIIETLLHKAIDKTAQIVACIAKAFVTLLCLGASVAYSAGVKAREILDTNIIQETDKSIDDGLLMEHEQEVTEIEHVPASLDDTIAEDVSNNIVPSINMIHPIISNTRTNNLEVFVATGLANILAKNILEATSYKLPRNKRTKKQYTRHNDIGILTEFYELLVSKGVLT